MKPRLGGELDGTILRPVVLLIAAMVAGGGLARAGDSGGPQVAPRSLASQGIVVPKRPALIAGLNQQFRSRQQPGASNGTQTAGASAGQLALNRVANRSLQAAKQLVGNLMPAIAANQKQKLGKKQQQHQTATGELHLDKRHEQEPSEQAAHKQTDQIQQRSSSLTQQQQQQVGATGAQNQNRDQLQQQRTIETNGQQQLYRGYSLIELEVRCESDRRYVQELYGNLSAALNEQAAQKAGDHQGATGTANQPATAIATAAASGVAVSPYADIDFWSFKTALNDQIDIMVSPKSRAFIINQLNRAKIKHRVKIDDIQARLDAQLPPAAAGPAHANPSIGSSSELAARTEANNSRLDLISGGGAKPANGNNNNNNNNNNGHSQQHLAGRQQSQSQPGGPSDSPGASQPPATSFYQASGQLFTNDSLFFENYQRLNEINQYLESVVGRARDIARVQVIGRSTQGRYLRVLQLGYEQRDIDGSTAPVVSPAGDTLTGEVSASASASGTGTSDQLGAAPAQPPPSATATKILEQFYRRHQSVKKLGSIWLDGGTHAREWISPATVLYIAYRLSDNHSKCLKFFDYLNMAVSQVENQHQNQKQARSAARPQSAQLDDDLLNGINEINTSLLGATTTATGHGANKPTRRRSELEQKLELLAKRPQEVAQEHQCDLELEQLLRRYTFYIMPVLNPDGYEYSHTHNRLWRKTRSTSNHPIYRHFCLGADPNRNYDARHGSTGSSGHPCSQTYGGATPFTEPETRHQSNFVYAHRNKLKMFISFHSYSQMILLPFSHSKQLAPDHKDLESVGQAAVRAIERTHGTQYRVGASASILYTASGTASDWAYEKAGIKYSYTIELRDTGAYGFLLPRQQIVPTGEETFNGLLAMIGQMEKQDNLLTSKSSISPPLGGGLTAANGSRDDAAATGDFVHAPDLDQLRPFNRFRPRPAQLENALDGSDTWATPQPPVLGVRDRRPPGTGGSTAAAAHQQQPPLVKLTENSYLLDESGDMINSGGGRFIEDEIVATPSEEPDAGYAFEGEGELMEPTADGQHQHQSLQLARQRSGHRLAQLYGHIHAHAGDEQQQQQQPDAAGDSSVRVPALPLAMGLSANGRNLINSPPLPSKQVSTASHQHRRESSAIAAATEDQADPPAR